MRVLLRREKQVVRQFLTALCLIYMVFCYTSVQVAIPNVIRDSDILPGDIEPQMDDTTEHHNPEYSEESEVFPSDIVQMIDGTKETRDDDPILINYIKHQLTRPAPDNKQLNLSRPIHTGQIGQAETILKYFDWKTSGVFIEAGAWDGEYLSNTLFLEANASWTGLLVEPNIKAFTKIQQRNRKAHSINACLAVTPHPAKVDFDAADVFGGISKSLEADSSKSKGPIFDIAQIFGFDFDKSKNLKHMRDSIPAGMRSKYPVQAYPLYSLILAMGIKHVDFLSLDVEGAELDVIKTVPWEKVDIELVMVEVEHSDVRAITKTMRAAGYMKWKNLNGIDIIFRKIRK